MDHWNKGGAFPEEFLRMRENALRQLQELAKRAGEKTSTRHLHRIRML